MPVLVRLLTQLYGHIADFKAWVILALLLVYLLVSWALFALAGENELTGNPVDFLYFAATTASTVGYGDMSPATPAGKLVAALWFFPGALVIFTAVLGKLTAVLVEGVRRMAEGRASFENLTGATVIIGYHADRTERIVRDILADDASSDDIVILTRKRDINVPNGSRFVLADRLDAVASLKRSGVVGAANVLVYTDSDAETFNACLAVRELNPTVHVAAYFDDQDTARRAERLAQVEPVISHSTEILVRAAQDPGSSRVLSALSSAATNSTIFSGTVGREQGASSEGLRRALHLKHATLVAVAGQGQASITFSPLPDHLAAQTVIYYIAEKRLDETTWNALMAEAG